MILYENLEITICKDKIDFDIGRIAGDDYFAVLDYESIVSARILSV